MKTNMDKVISAFEAAEIPFVTRKLRRSKGTVVVLVALSVDEGEVTEESAVSLVFDRKGNYVDTQAEED